MNRRGHAIIRREMKNELKNHFGWYNTIQTLNCFE